MKAVLKFLVIMCIAFLPFCCSRGKAVESPDIVIGEYGSLTGTAATFGISTRNGIEMALDEVNKSGGILGKKVRVVIEDDQGRPEEAQTVVTKLVNKDRVLAVLGEASSSRSLAAAPVCQQGRIPMISPSSTSPKVTQVGDYIFRVCFIDTFQGEVMAKFITNTLKLHRMGILRDIRNEYSVGLADIFAQQFAKRGGTIVADESYSEGDNDFSAQLTSMKSKNPEGIFVPGYYTEAGLIARQARKLGLTIPLLGGDGWDSTKLWEIGGEALNGCYYSSHYSAYDPNPVIQKFVGLYKTRYGGLPDTNAVLGYDAARILFDAFQRAKTTNPEQVRTALAQTRDFPGVTGKITMDQNRNPIKPAVVLKVNNGKMEYVETISP